EGLRRERRRRERTEALDQLAQALDMEEVPIRIEGYDISNLGPEHTVASMVVFEGGAPKKSNYRRFNIRGRTAGADDFASLDQVLTRRLDRYMSESERSPHDAELDESFASLPSLIMIDGGKGQLAAGIRALAPLIERGTTVISLAKRLEEVYVPGRSAPLPIPADSEASRLLQRVRDEAHRFALDLHRKRRSKSMTGSILDGLRGVGPARKRALLSHFGSPERFLHASREELEAVPGIPGKLARDIHRQINKTGATPTAERVAAERSS
ncbi:MAG: excinuclease ABC subunit UvrC, partial [Solirubrobacterales bacterium]|nr:excinuclease ABC subunit UvrC [Solirubrobacterales bacterium]